MYSRKLMRQTPTIELYIAPFCVDCERAVALLEGHGLPFERIDLGDPSRCCRLHELTGGASVPQAKVEGRRLGGYDELAAFVHRYLNEPGKSVPDRRAASSGDRRRRGADDQRADERWRLR